MSAEKIDHKAEAQQLTAIASEHDSVAAATSAVAEATLYAAEQQQLANLIAYWAAMTEEKLAYLNEQDKTRFRAVQELIEEGLGLA